MFTKLFTTLTLAMALAAGLGAVRDASAASVTGTTVISQPAFCVFHPAAYALQITQGTSIYSLKQLVLNGNCFSQGAYIFVVNGVTGNQATPGQQFLQADRAGNINYAIPSTTCTDQLVVFVRDIATGRQATGPDRACIPCQTPPPAFQP